MRAKMTKIMSSLMAIVLITSVFTACGDNNNDETTTTTNPSTVQSDATTDGGEDTTEPSSEDVADPSSEDTTDHSSEGTTKPVDTTKPNDKTTKPDGTTKPTSNTAKPTTTKAPSTKAEILKYYKDAVAKVNSSKAGFTKTRHTEAGKYDLPGIYSAVKGLIDLFMGMGPDNVYTTTANKGSFGGEIRVDKNDIDRTYYYLANVKLTEADIKSATCKKSGDNYIITINLNAGSSQAGKDLKIVNASPLDRSGLCMGDRDCHIFDHKSAEIIYDAIHSSPLLKGAKINVKEKTPNSKIVATVNASTGRFSDIKITFDLECILSVGKKDLEATGTTVVEYKDFKW